MKLDIYRASYGARSTLGKLYVDRQLECYTLEPAKDNPLNPGHPCIAPGKFKIELTLSPHFHYVTPEVMNVPGRSYIRIHRANKPEQLLGCTAVGESQSPDWVGESEIAFDKLMVLLKTANDRGEEITAEWHDPQ